MGYGGYFDLFRKKAAPTLHQAGDRYFFGSYYFEESGAIQPLEWIVAEVTPQTLLLVSRYCLEKRLYCDSIPDSPEKVRWEHSALRRWLNTCFYDTAFQEFEKASLVETVICEGGASGGECRDKVFLLSPEQVMTLLSPEHRFGIPTPYVRAKLEAYYAEPCWWWTLPAVMVDGIYPSVCLGTETDYHSRLIFSNGAHNTAVRPAIRIRR